MGAVTKIEWCDHTFNPWWGCTQVSPLCDHCYAMMLDARWFRRSVRASAQMVGNGSSSFRGHVVATHYYYPLEQAD